MLTQIKEKLYIKKNIKKDVSVLYTELKSIRERSYVLAICPTPTGHNWLGIRNVTRLIFEASTLELPQYYSASVYNNDELIKIAGYISELKFKTVVFGCYINYFSVLINRIHKHSENSLPVINILFHGALSELANYRPVNYNFQENNFAEMLELFHSGRINRIGFFKRDLAEYFNKLFNTDRNYYVIGKPKIIEVDQKIMFDNDAKHIGIFGINIFNKNIHNQVAAALLPCNTIVHILDTIDFAYLRNESRIIRHKRMETRDFYRILGSMCVNLHISFSESWGQIVTESLALGVPCITSNNNGIFDFDPYLKQMLVVDEYDNPLSIANKIDNVLSQRDQISLKGAEYIETLHKIAEEKIKIFLDV